MSAEEPSEQAPAAKSPPLSPSSPHSNTFPPTRANGETSTTSTSPPELEDKSIKKSEKRAPPPALPLSNTVSPASLYSVLPASGLSNQLNAGPSVINKQLLSKLNKSLKEKQKVINTKESHVRNPAMIQDVMSPALQQSFNVSGASSSDILGAQNNVPLNESMDLDRAVESDVSTSNGGQGKDDPSLKAKSKLVAKQNSTRTDFFAAKLAIAVDDVESSDSDETFIYETNVNEYSADDPSSLPAPITQEESRKAVVSISADSASTVQKPLAPQIVSETSSLNGSVRVNPIDSHTNSPTTELRKEEDPFPLSVPPQRPSVTKAESIHSLQSIKYNLRNTFNTTPPGASNVRSQSLAHSNYNSAENPAYSNPYFDQNTKSKSAGRDSVQLMMSDDEEREPGMRCSMLHYGDSTLMQYGINEGLNQAPSLNEPYADAHFSYDEEDEVSEEESSSHDDINLVSTDVNANNAIPSNSQRPADIVSVSSKAKKTKSSTTSSKLRSTTSKLFDKKGAQPRRYSTIPDDIDIEDFDDELIYYDNNNIRFPYGNNNEHSNESSSLVGGKLPHYRSLNLNFGARRPSKNAKPQRYLSLGYVPSPHQPNGNKRNDIFPFPYLEHDQPYLDFNEYDEDPKFGDQLRGKRLSSNRSHFPGSGDYGSVHYSSQENKKNGRAAFFRSLIYTFVAITFILALGFVLGFFLASTKELSNVSIVSIENPLVSQDELVFSIVIEALNPGWFTISIQDLELDIFAKSGYLGEESIQGSLETVLLGSVLNFESAVSFEGLFFHRKRSRHLGEIKLVSPGKNITGSKLKEMVTKASTTIQVAPQVAPTDLPDNSEKWAIISKHPFDLILRGVLKYNLPLTSSQKAVVVNKVGYVDPSIPS